MFIFRKTQTQIEEKQQKCDYILIFYRWQFKTELIMAFNKNTVNIIKIK